MGRVAVEDPIAGTLSYRKLLIGARILGEQADAARAGGQADRPDAAERQRRGGDADGADVGRPRAGDDQLHRRRRQRAGRLQGGAGRHHPHLARLHREGPARRADRGRSQKEVKIVYLDDIRADHHARRQAARLLELQEAAGRSASPTTGRRSCSPRARRARRRAWCCPTATCWPTPRRPRRASTSAARTRCSTCCRCSTRSG